ncbi:lipoprotein-anchoring transpeptidase ErfK/SrfK [Pullulanibacillus pueri]|uniref:Transpeptidase n=1 Tax=Pullulanibacillus pueri TaxID=1437324 RepID=A0A8J2ZVC3_9BACL|nr:L,D-transpeptidase [Pullulanibacillus pueri]MBM7681617.1 lipoprotein-anchoring transpeptidase ErfK/SrfK [Pullulanibacillus pueri]GGH79434.1 transpeptidase [Pullulanibacillus pueri]
MNTLITLLMSLVVSFSPIWPLGQNPTYGDPFIIVNKETNRLAFVKDNQMVMEVPVATGKSEGLTPEGLFTMTVKAINPYYRKKNIPGGDPKNPLGSRWMGFDAKGTDGRIYGIHGTNQPKSIGERLTAGCIRMQKKDLETLYNQAPLGTRILIIKSNQSAQKLAIEYGALKP